MAEHKNEQEIIVEENDDHDDDSSSSNTSRRGEKSNMEDVMESMVRISLAGLGGSIVGLALEKRLENMRVTTAAGLTAAARRKRSPTASVNLPVTWAVSCTLFCMIIETCRLLSPSTMILNQIEAWSGNKIPLYEYTRDDKQEASTTSTRSRTIRPPVVTIADYTIGGAFAGLAGSFGRQVQFRNAISKLQGSQRLFGVGPGIALGLAAGCIQAATDYGMVMAEKAAKHDHQSS